MLLLHAVLLAELTHALTHRWLETRLWTWRQPQRQQHQLALCNP